MCQSGLDFRRNMCMIYVCIECFGSNAHYVYAGCLPHGLFCCIPLSLSAVVPLAVCFHLPTFLSLLRVFRRIKEQHCYCAPDLAKEYSKYDTDPRKFFRKYTGKRVRRGRREGGVLMPCMALAVWP